MMVSYEAPSFAMLGALFIGGFMEMFASFGFRWLALAAYAALLALGLRFNKTES